MIQRAMKLAVTAGHKCHKHVAFVVRGGAVIAYGVNRNTIHAEAAALRHVRPEDSKGAKLYSFRLRRSGTIGLAKPCPKCEALLRERGIKCVIYSDNEGKLIRMKLQPDKEEVGT